jgi:hypothetical protein
MAERPKMSFEDGHSLLPKRGVSSGPSNEKPGALSRDDAYEPIFVFDGIEQWSNETFSNYNIRVLSLMRTQYVSQKLDRNVRYWALAKLGLLPVIFVAITALVHR